jgi:hypothetical protein
MAYVTPQHIARTYPEKGCFYYELESTIPAGTYPTDGDGFGATSTTPTLWAAMGLAAGDFEVEICYVNVAASSFMVIHNNFSGNDVTFTPGSSLPGFRIKDGFYLTGSGVAGGSIGFKVHVYRQPSSY